MKRLARSVGILLVFVTGTVGAQASKAPTKRSAQTGWRILVSARDSGAHVYRDDGGGITDSLRIVIQDSATFAGFWQRLVSSYEARRVLPVVDFATHDVIVAALGARGAEGPRISIDTVKVRAGRRIVVVRRTFPLEHCMDSTQSYLLGRPVDVIVVPRADARITRFVERVIHLSDCGQPHNS